jgi:outer membrane protein assembly factor BamB
MIEKSTVPLPWSSDDVAWNVKLPGKGNGSPIIQGNFVYIQSADPQTAERHLLSFDLTTGQERWRKSYPSSQYKLHARSSYASSTPCANDKAVFFVWGAPEGVTVKAFSHSGEELWSRDFPRYISQHGFGGSPMLFGDKLILLDSQDALELPEGVAPGQTVVYALDVQSGKTVWQTPRETTRVCYGVPASIKDTSGRDLLIMNETGDGIFALDAQTGAPAWNRKTFTKRCVSSPVVVGDLVIGTEGSGGGGNVLFAVDTKRDHDLAFDIRKSAPYVPTPVAKGDLLFLWADNGIVSCVQVPSGEIVWSERVGGNVSSSPVIVGDKLVGIAEDGTVTIVSATRTFKALGQVKLGETTRSTPALREDCMLVRTDSTLMRIGRASR